MIKTIYPRNPKKDLPKLDEVPRKRRKLLDASTVTAATVVAPLVMEKASLVMPKAQYPTLMNQNLLGELPPEGGTAEAPGRSGGGRFELDTWERRCGGRGSGEASQVMSVLVIQAEVPSISTPL